MRARDIIEIENLQNRYMHLLISGNFEQVQDLFSDDPEASFGFASRKRIPFVGKKEIHEKMFLGRMCGDFTEYDRFHAGGQIVAPFIDVSDDGIHAFGMFPSYGFFVKGKVFNINEPPYPAGIGNGMWYHEFVKEDGVWKIFKFRTGSLPGAASWEWTPFVGEGYAELGIARQIPAPPAYIDLKK